MARPKDELRTATGPARDAFEELELDVAGMTCASCAARVEKILGRQEGVEGASVNFAANRARVTYQPETVSLDELSRAAHLLPPLEPVANAASPYGIAWLADRVRRTWIIAGACGLWSLFTALCGSATNFLQLAFYRMGVGVGEGRGVGEGSGFRVGVAVGVGDGSGSGVGSGVGVGVGSGSGVGSSSGWARVNATP